MSTLENSPCRSAAGRRTRMTARFLVAFIFLFGVFLWKIPSNARLYLYSAVRESLKACAVAGTWRMEKISSEHFYVKFRPENRTEAMLVLETAERFYRPVTEDFHFRPRGKVPVILYPSREELNASFGWEANENAMGVYWAGAIRVLSPNAWIGEADQRKVKEIFISSGPMAHELTHLMVDYLTGGNYPRWFTEGVAQYEEYKLTGFQFNEPAGSLQQDLYSMEALSRDFDSLPNQSLAYRQSFAAVRYIVDEYGEDNLHQIIRMLRYNRDFDSVIHDVLGLSPADFEREWKAWAEENRQLFG